MTETPPSSYVTITSQGEEISALDRPQFLIQVGSKYYATLALLEYDTKEQHLSEVQRAYLPDPIKHLFAKAATHGVVHGAVQLESYEMLRGGSTHG